jgi:3-methyl-2-oxobutanoate hydroxymethyltransferase
MKVHHFIEKKQAGDKITLITCYDYTFASLIQNTNIDCVLVGDSGSMVMQGCKDTTAATLEMMLHFTQAVSRGIKNKFIVADMPFLSYRKSLADSVATVQKFIQAGAHSIKLEGAEGNLELIKHLTNSGVPVMGHLGLTPQSVHLLGGYKIQGRSESQVQTLMKQAQQLEKAGCYALVLECVPWQVAKTITDYLSIPTIGIGAGPHTDGQVLVLHDLLGLSSPEQHLKFNKAYLPGFQLCQKAINAYVAEVQQQQFPELATHCFE